MIKITEKIWIGDALDEQHVDLQASEINGILNVAHDMQCTRGWTHGVEYAQVGLIDGPGNSIQTYCAAVLALGALLKRRDRVLVCCHSGTRSLVIAVMYINAVVPGRKWDNLVELIQERIGLGLDTPDRAHLLAFENIPWSLLAKLLEK